jgi:uncharacterized protein
MRGEPPLRSLVSALGRGHFADGGCLNQAKRVTTAEKVRFLASLEAYPGSTGPVGVEETHMSWVFLVDERVYKLKKPVRYPFLDFTTLEARKANCREEVRLNRRLAPEVYLGVMALIVGADGRLAIKGEGEVVDWLVKMRRLPADRMLDRAITAGTIGRQEVNAVARRLSQFYLDTKPVTISGADYVHQFAHEQAINREILTERGFDLDRGRVEQALACVEDVLHGPAGILQQRAEAGKIVEGHGDLRPEHICLVHPPVIIDCLEFARHLRLVDPIDELLFLTLECQRLGAGWVGELILAHYLEGSKDHPTDELVSFYWSYRACLRARLSLVHLLEPDPRSPEKWLPLARNYIEIACRPPVTAHLRADR